jgi:hypothetical protein
MFLTETGNPPWKSSDGPLRLTPVTQPAHRWYAWHLSVKGRNAAPEPDFFSCTSCQRPDGTYVGSGGQMLHLSDVQHSKLSKDLLKPILGGIGDPATADIPRTLQLSFHVRF